MKKTLCLFFIMVSAFATREPAVTSELENELEKLNLPENMAPAKISQEKLYALQSRFSNLARRHEVSLGGGNNFSPDDHLSSRRIDLSYRYHINNRFSGKAEVFKVFNKLNTSGQNLVYEKGIIPATDYQRAGFALGANYNLLYGKFAFGLDKAYYFDHYIGASIGSIILNSGAALMAQAETGLAFWLGKWGSLRVGFKDEVHRENRGSGKRFSHNLIGQVNFGILLGGR